MSFLELQKYQLQANKNARKRHLQTTSKLGTTKRLDSESFYSQAQLATHAIRYDTFNFKVSSKFSSLDDTLKLKVVVVPLKRIIQR